MLRLLRVRLAAFAALPRDARLYVCAGALSAFATGAFAAVYNLYVLALGYDTAFLGTLLVVASVGAGAAVVPAGALVDRVGARGLLLGGSLVVAGGIGAQLVVPLAAVLVGGNLLAGAGAAAFFVAAAPFLARTVPPARQNAVFSLDTAAALAGTALGSIVAGQVAALAAGAGPAGAQPYRLALVLGSAVGALSFPVLLATQGSAGAAAPGAEGSRAAGAGLGVAPALGVVASWRAVLRDGAALRLGVTTALIGLGAGLFVPFLNVYFVDVLGASPAVYGWVSGATTLTRLGATLLAPPVAALLGTAGAIAGTQLASVPFLLLLGFAPQLPVAAGAVVVRGALMNMAAPLQTSLTMGRLRPESRGSGNAFLLLVANLTRAASTLAGGALIEQTGYRWPYLLTAVLYAAASVLLWLWFGERPLRRPPGGR